MKRINIVGFIDFHREEWDIRPSMVDKIRQAFHDSELWTYKDLCACTEKQLLKIRHVTPELVEHVKETLENVGLHLGMTEKELDAYHDAEYDARHQSVEPKGTHVHDDVLNILDGANILEFLRKKAETGNVEKGNGTLIPEGAATEQIVGVDKIEGSNLSFRSDAATEQIAGTSKEDRAEEEAKEEAVSANTDGMQKKEIESLQETEQKKGTEQLQETEPLQEMEAKHKKKFDAQKVYNHAMARILCDPCQMLRGDDLEFMRHQLVMSVLEQQSWLMRTFCSFNYRVKVAMRKANYIMLEYRHDMGLRSTVYQHLEYEGTIKELEA